jgi:hypothetical protein
MYSINQLNDFLRRFNCVRALIDIGNISKKLFNEHKFFHNVLVKVNNRTAEQTITQWGLAFIAYRLMMVSNGGKKRNFTWEDLAKAHSTFGELDDPFLHDRDLLGFLFRVSQEQFWWQEINLPSLWSRYKYIFNSDSFFSENFSKMSGLTIEEYFLLGIAVLGFINREISTPVFSIDNLKSSSIPSPFKELLDEEKINLFLKLTSGNYQIIRDESQKINKLTIPKYERFEFNPLFKYPIIQGDSRFSYYSSFQFIVPNVMLLLKKIAQGVYWDLRGYFVKLDTQNSQDFLNLRIPCGLPQGYLIDVVVCITWARKKM